MTLRCLRFKNLLNWNNGVEPMLKQGLHISRYLILCSLKFQSCLEHNGSPYSVRKVRGRLSMTTFEPDKNFASLLGLPRK